MEKLEVGDLVLCTVDRIVGTVVFVKIPIENAEIEGSILMSEIAPGRIRNIRDYVVPKKKIVCKVLRLTPNGNIELSLRRVSQKEKKEIIEQDKQEKSYASILKSVLGEKSEETIKEILKEERLFSFLEEAKENPEKLEKIAGKENSKKILEIIKTQKKKKAIIKKEIHLTTIKPNGISLIKKILEDFKGLNVKYISAGRYSLELESEDLKKADKKIRDSINIAEKDSRKLDIEFSVK
jgi:translation initiation factor 2 alpha subunit (eIF-2alpha)